MDGAGEIKKGGNNMRRSVMKEWFISSQVVQSMLLVQLFATGVQLLSRVILVQGTFIFALIAYRHLVAAIFVAPLALYLERNRPKMFHWRVWFWLFINALVGMTMALGLFYFGLRDTSATYSINFLNLIPIFTFLTSIICRMENVRLQTWAGKAKIVGAIFCVGGALATSLYKGKEIHIYHHRDYTHININVPPPKIHMLRGTLFLIGSCCSYTAWFIIQVKLLSIFPLRYWGTMLTCIMAAIQSAIIGAIIDPSKASWRLKWDLQLITIVYSGALATAASFCLITWSITIKGPTYPPMFNPLALIFVALAEAIFFGEPLRVGTLLGMVLIISGLYFFLWGKSNDKPLLPPTNVTAVPELSASIADEAAVAVALSTVVVVTSSSPNATGVLDIEKAEETPLKPFNM